MKNLILALALIAGALTASAKGAACNDTIQATSAKIDELITEKLNDENGKTSTKYYILYDGELVPTSKSVIDNINLCLKYKAKISIAIVVNKKTNRKRIILN